MTNLTKNTGILIGDSSFFGRSLGQHLTDLGFKVALERNESVSLFKFIEKNSPGMVIFKAETHAGDVCSFIADVNRNFPDTSVFVMSALSGKFRQETVNLGISELIALPTTVSEMHNYVFSGAKKAPEYDSLRLRSRIKGYLVNMKVPSSFDGYKYTVNLIEMCIKYPRLNFAQNMSLFYSKIAEHHNISAERVERSVRYLTDTYSGAVMERDIKLSNSEFIVMLADGFCTANKIRFG